MNATEELARKMCDEDAAFDDGVPSIEGYHADWSHSDPERRKYWLDRARSIIVRRRTGDTISMSGI